MVKFHLGAMLSILGVFFRLFTTDPGLHLASCFSLDKNLHMTGSILPVTDSLIILAASGGLYSINPNQWIKLPDSTNKIVSISYRPEFDNVLFSTYNKSLDQGFVIWQYEDQANMITDTIAIMDSCLCYVEASKGMVLVHGLRNNTYNVWELTSTGINEIFTLPFAPTGIQIVNKTTLLVSFFNKIIWINKETGASEFYNGPEELIVGFYLSPEAHLYISTQNGISEVINGRGELRIPNVKGTMTYRDGHLYVLDQEKNTITLLKELN